jgi:hypothetical protein
VSGTDVLTTLELRGRSGERRRDLVVRSFQDVEDIIERNKRLQNEPQKSDWGRHIATIPNNILLKWMLEEGVPVLGMPAHEWDKFLRKKLNDPDWRHLRTA